MRTERTALPGYGSVKPYRQGELSSLCGIYAPINAARLLAANRASERAIWAEAYNLAVTKLSGQRKLKNGLKQGLTYETWKVLQHALYDHLSGQLGVTLRMRPLWRRSVSPGRDLAKDICKALDAGKAVLCALCGPHDHYTVIAGYTASRWLLHDSAGLRWIERAATAVGRPQGRLHWLPFTSLIVLAKMEEIP